MPIFYTGVEADQNRFCQFWPQLKPGRNWEITTTITKPITDNLWQVSAATETESVMKWLIYQGIIYLKTAIKDKQQNLLVDNTGQRQIDGGRGNSVAATRSV